MSVVDWPPPQQPRRRGLMIFFAVLFAAFLSGGTALSYYIESMWFDSLGYGEVFWTNLNLRAGVFAAFTATTFLVLYGSFLLLKPAHFGELAGGTIIVGG